MADAVLSALSHGAQTWDCLGSLRAAELWRRDVGEVRVTVERSDWNRHPLTFVYSFIHSSNK